MLLLPPRVDKLSVILGLTPREDDESRLLLQLLLVALLLLLMLVLPARSVPMMVLLEDNVEKLDGLELEKPFSNSELISVDGRNWYILLVVPVAADILLIDDFG